MSVRPLRSLRSGFSVQFAGIRMSGTEQVLQQKLVRFCCQIFLVQFFCPIICPIICSIICPIFLSDFFVGLFVRLFARMFFRSFSPIFLFDYLTCVRFFLYDYLSDYLSDYSRFSSLFAAEGVSRGGSASRNVPSVEERGETDVLEGYPIFLPDYLSIFFVRVFV